MCASFYHAAAGMCMYEVSLWLLCVSDEQEFVRHVAVAAFPQCSVGLFYSSAAV